MVGVVQCDYCDDLPQFIFRLAVNYELYFFVVIDFLFELVDPSGLIPDRSAHYGLSIRHYFEILRTLQGLFFRVRVKSVLTQVIGAF